MRSSVPPVVCEGGEVVRGAALEGVCAGAASAGAVAWRRARAVRGQLESHLAEVEGISQASPQIDGWPEVVIATGIGLRAPTAAVAAVPERQVLALADRTIVVGELRIDVAARRQRHRGREGSLTLLLHQVLATMATEPHRSFTNDELLQRVWGKRRDGGRGHAVNHAVTRIRNTLVATGRRGRPS